MHDGTTTIVNSITADGMSEIDNLMASGEIVPAQLPVHSEWSPCKMLAASILASALVEIRDHSHNPSYRKRVEEDLEWIECGEVDWPFSFLRICELIGLDPEWARETVYLWLAIPPSERKKPGTPYRQAA